jgi:hypothetical protein
MNSQELFDNFFWTCLKYAVDNGGVDDYTLFTSCVDLFSPDNETVQILRWDHPSTPPTDEQLSAYTVDDANNIKDLFDDISLVKQGRPVATITEHMTILAPFAQKGQLAYNTSDSSLYMFVNGAWIKI